MTPMQQHADHPYETPTPGGIPAPDAAPAQGSLEDAPASPGLRVLEEPAGTSEPAPTAASSAAPSGMLADPDGLRRQWEAVQVHFVDDPRGAVRDADALVAATIAQLTESFDRQREGLEATWHDESTASTDDLRAAFATYRDFFNRLLSA